MIVFKYLAAIIIIISVVAKINNPGSLDCHRASNPLTTNSSQLEDADEETVTDEAAAASCKSFGTGPTIYVDSITTITYDSDHQNCRQTTS